jgi:hypothetical protein
LTVLQAPAGKLPAPMMRRDMGLGITNIRAELPMRIGAATYIRKLKGERSRLIVAASPTPSAIPR